MSDYLSSAFQRACTGVGLAYQNVSDFAQALHPGKQAALTFLSERILSLEEANDTLISEYLSLVDNATTDPNQKAKAVQKVASFRFDETKEPSKIESIIAAMEKELEILEKHNEELQELCNEATADLYEISLRTDLDNAAKMTQNVATVVITQQATTGAKGNLPPPPRLGFIRKEFVETLQKTIREEMGRIIQEKDKEVFNKNESIQKEKNGLIANRKNINKHSAEFKENENKIQKLHPLPTFSQQLSKSSKENTKIIIDTVFYCVAISKKPATMKDDVWQKEVANIISGEEEPKTQAGKALKSEWEAFSSNPMRYLTPKEATKPVKTAQSGQSAQEREAYVRCSREYAQKTEGISEEQALALKPIPLGLVEKKMKDNAIEKLKSEGRNSEEIENILHNPDLVLEKALLQHMENMQQKIVDTLIQSCTQAQYDALQNVPSEPGACIRYLISELFPKIKGLADLQEKPQALLDTLFRIMIVKEALRDIGRSENTLSDLTLTNVLDQFESIKATLKKSFNEKEWPTVENNPEKLYHAYIEKRRDTSQYVSLPNERHASLPNTISESQYAEGIQFLKNDKALTQVFSRALDESRKPSSDFLRKLAQEIERISDLFASFSLMQQLWLIEQSATNRLNEPFVSHFISSISSNKPEEIGKAQKIYSYLVTYSEPSSNNPYKEKYAMLLSEIQNHPQYASIQQRL